jgi:hypothetical protein
VHKWDMNVVPVYFVVVIVPDDPAQWIRHDADGTFHGTAAFWARLVPGQIGATINVPKSQRLSMDTLYIWHNDLLDLFRPGGGGNE